MTLHNYHAEHFGASESGWVELHNGDCLDVMQNMPNGSIDLTVTSPPYDNLRTYNSSIDWGEHVWRPVISELFRVTASGGAVVWIVNDATIKGSETGTSFKQAIHAMDCGFNLHDTMIYQKVNAGAAGSMRGYLQSFEYMFIFSKGRIKTFNPIKDRANKEAGRVHKNPARLDSNGLRKKQRSVTIEEYGRRFNIWPVVNTDNQYNKSLPVKDRHPAVFPPSLARDHVLSWSNSNDVVFDPFMGSGTTGVVCRKLGREFIGIEKDEKYFELAKKQDRREPIITPR